MSCSNVKIDNGGNTTEGIYCNYCGKLGHIKQAVSRSREGTHNFTIPIAILLLTVTTIIVIVVYIVSSAVLDAEEFEDDIWIGDSGASSHYCASDRGMFDVRETNENIGVGNGDLFIGAKVGSLKFKVIKIDGSTFNIIHHNVTFVPDPWVNLFCIYQSSKKCRKISSNKITALLNKGSTRITFDRVFKAKDGTV